jgi:hypothetical protein
MLLNTIPCSHCGSHGLVLEPDGVATCQFCGTPNAVQGTICSTCEWVNPANQETCETCNTALFRTCPACNAKNWAGATACVKCGETLDTLAYMTSRLQQADTSQRLTSRSRAIKEVKAEEERASQKRTAQFEEVEKRRLRGLSNARTQQAGRESQIMTLAFIALVVFGLVIVAALFFAFGPR